MTVINELDSTCGISDEELTQRFKESIRIDDEIRKENISFFVCQQTVISLFDNHDNYQNHT